MSGGHLEILVEEASMEAFLQALLPKILLERLSFAIHSHQGKADLLGKLPSKLRGYAKWLPENYRIVIVVDRDGDDCAELKTRLERVATSAGLKTRTSACEARWQLVNRIAVEELEAWFFGNWAAVRAAYPRVSARTSHKAAFRDCDAIDGGTWEALERIMKKAGYFKEGLAKGELASCVAKYFDPETCTSRSFQTFKVAIIEAIHSTAT